MRTVAVPLPDFVAGGNTLVDWLGLFWTRIYENPDLVRSFEQGQGLLAAQLYLRYIETLNLRDRNNVPVFRRERWKPITIRRSEANTGSAALLRLGMEPTPVIGPQTSPAFIPGTVFEIGGYAAFNNAVSYPVLDLSDICTSISDNIVRPSTVLVRDSDFVVSDNTLFFLRGSDPFADPNFPRRIITNDDGTEDEEILLWAADILIDEDYLYKYIGYVLNLRTEDNEFYKRMLNGLWDIYNLGTPISIVQSGIGAMLGEPTIIHASETVDKIITQDDNVKIVTDKEVYTVSIDATLRASVVEGAVLKSGEFLTETIRIYETLDPMKMDAVSEFGERMREDMYAIFFNPNMLSTNVRFGIGASWVESDIVNAGFDTNGNAKLKFDLYGNAEDIDAFWTDFWTYLENNNLSSETCFREYLNDIVVPVEGAVYGRVRPLEYIMRYFLRTNAFAVVVERDHLADPPVDRNPMGLLSLLRDVIPAHVLMLVFEQQEVGPDEYDLEELESSLEQTHSLVIESSATYGTPSVASMTYLDRPPVRRWIPQCQ